MTWYFTRPDLDAPIEQNRRTSPTVQREADEIMIQ